MKKAKFMLAAVGLFAVAGAVLAFKSKTNHSLFLGTAKNACSNEKIDVTFTSTEAQPVTYGSVYYTFDADEPNCNVKTTIYTTIE